MIFCSWFVLMAGVSFLCKKKCDVEQFFLLFVFFFHLLELITLQNILQSSRNKHDFYFWSDTANLWRSEVRPAKIEGELCCYSHVINVIISIVQYVAYIYIYIYIYIYTSSQVFNRPKNENRKQQSHYVLKMPAPSFCNRCTWYSQSVLI
jgi:hypothetical protein